MYGQVRSLLILASHMWKRKYRKGKRGHFAGKIDVFHYCSVGCTLNSWGTTTWERLSVSAEPGFT